MSRLNQPLDSHERVIVNVEVLKNIPPEANPFHHDAFNMGTDLARGWMAMHAGFDNKESPFAMEYIILVNTRTGQRFRINLLPEVPKRKKVVYIVTGEDVDDTLGALLLIREHGNEVFSLNFNKIIANPEELYVRVNEGVIQLTECLTLDTAKAAWEDQLCADFSETEWRKVFPKLVDTLIENIERNRLKHPQYDPLNKYGMDYETLKTIASEFKKDSEHDC